MTINQEIEYKQLLSANQYNNIKKAFFNNKKPFTQTNFYIDTPNFELAEQLMALRIRQFGNNYEMTLKVLAKIGLTEYNHETDIVPEEGLHIQPEQLPDDIYSVLQKSNINFNQLNILGALTTHRIETEIKEGLLVLDHSEYLGAEDYELEFEVENPEVGLKKFQEILKEFNIKSEIPKNKVARFFEAKSK